MHFNYKFWEMNQVQAKIKDENLVLCFKCPDAFSESLLKELLGFEANNKTVVLAKSMNEDWVRENIFSLNLFSQDDFFHVIEAQQVSESCAKFLKENEKSLIDCGKKTHFWFRGKSTLFDYWAKKSDLPCINIDAPMFWEFNKVLTFLADHFDLKLNSQSQQFILTSVEQDLASYITLMRKIKLRWISNEIVPLEIIKECAGTQRLDQFELASNFGRKELSVFFRKLEKHSSDYKLMDNLFRFLEGHILKLMDCSYIEKKARPSKYDKQIQAHSKIWKKEELKRFLVFLSELMILSKKRDSKLRDTIRTSHLKLFI